MQWNIWIYVGLLFFSIAGRTEAPKVISKKEIYASYLNKTKISLSDLFAAIQGREAERKKIKKFADDQDSELVIKALQDRLAAEKAGCVQHSASPSICSKEIDSLQAKIDALHDAPIRSRSEGIDAKNLQWHLIVLNSIAENQVLNKFMNDWTKSCEKTGKINDPACKTALKNIGEFQDLFSGLLLLNLHALDSRNISTVDPNKLKEAIASYEN